MIALDTNVMVRFIVRDDEEQSERANQLICRGIERGERFFLADVVLAELVWVLGRSYRLDRDEVSDVLTSLLMASHLAFSSVDRVGRALRRYMAGAGDFADYVIAEQARDSDCEAVATFDRGVLNEDDFFRP